jgi:hypothetical protein
MGNCNKIKNTCPDSIMAPCVDYQGALGKNTKITSDCVTIADTTEDLYEITDEIIEDISVDELGNECIVYPSDLNTAKALKTHEEEICELKAQIEILQSTALCSLPIDGCGLQLGNLTNNCDTPIVTFSDLLQLMLDNLNNLIDD